MSALHEAAKKALEQLKINRTNFNKGPSKSICKMLASGNNEIIDELEAALVKEKEALEWFQEQKKHRAREIELSRNTLALDTENLELSKVIVEKCIAIVLKESKWYWDKNEFESSNTIQNAARRLKEYFGV